MRFFNTAVLLLACSGAMSLAADNGPATIGAIEDHALSQTEKEVVSLAEAMPADKYDFAPTQGAFQGVRTFGLQMAHIATVLDELAAPMLGEKATDTGEHENGPASLKGKDAIVSYLKNAFEHAHRAMKTVNAQNYTEMVTVPWGKMPRGAMADLMVSHTFDHYGQSVVYARMNDVVPPASR